MSDCEFESHQNCSENSLLISFFINLLDKRLWVQMPPELQWKLIRVTQTVFDTLQLSTPSQVNRELRD